MSERYPRQWPPPAPRTFQIWADGQMVGGYTTSDGLTASEILDALRDMDEYVLDSSRGKAAVLYPKNVGVLEVREWTEPS